VSILELIAIIFSFTSVWLSAKQNVFCWVTGMIGTICFFIIFLEQKLYSQTILQVLLFSQSIYGWYFWSKTKEGNGRVISIKPMMVFLIELSGILILAYVIGFFLKNYTDTQQPFLDATTACIGLLANWYLVKKIIQAWWLWIVIDILIAIIFYNQGLEISAILYLSFLLFSFNGLIRWSKNL